MPFRYIIPICLAFNTLGAISSFARPGTPGIKDHFELLKRDFAQGDRLEALQNLWEALLIDPYADEGRVYLQKFLNEPVLTTFERMKVMTVQDLLSQTQNLAQKRRYHTRKNSDLKKIILNEGVSSENLETYLDQSSPRSEDIPVSDAPAQFLADGSSWDQLRKILNDEKMHLETDVFRLERQYQALTRLHEHKTLAQRPATSSVIIVTDQPSADREMVIRNIPEQNFSAEDSAQLRILFTGLQTRITFFQEDLQRKDEMIDSLHQQMVDMNLNVVEHNGILTERINEFSELKARMDDVQSRFDLGQKIIQEKDVQISAMQGELVYIKEENQRLRNDMVVRLEAKDKKIQELSEMLDIVDLEAKSGNVKDYLMREIEENNSLSTYLTEHQQRLDASLQPAGAKGDR